MNTTVDIYEKYKKPIDELAKINPELGNFYKGEFLKKEAKKRGYKKGITCAFGKGAHNRIIRENEIRWVPDWQDQGALCMGMNVIFTQGNWAQILPQEKTVVPMAKALKIIAKKMKVSPENIEIQY